MSVTCPAGQAHSVDAYACVNQTGALGGVPQTVEDKKANSRWRQFVDALINYNPTDSLAFALNGDFGYDTALDPLTGSERAVWYGGMAAGRLAFNDVWAVALRGEWFRDPQGFMTGATNPTSGNPLDVIIRTGTLTLEAEPSPYLIVRLENRIDSANQRVPKGPERRERCPGDVAARRGGDHRSHVQCAHIACSAGSEVGRFVEGSGGSYSLQ
jgi:hypothetical protein